MEDRYFYKIRKRNEKIRREIRNYRAPNFLRLHLIENRDDFFLEKSNKNFGGQMECWDIQKINGGADVRACRRVNSNIALLNLLLR